MKDLFVNSWKIFLLQKVKLIAFSLVISILISLDLVLYIVLSQYGLEIISLLIFGFIIMGMFYSFQIAITQVSSGREIEYNDLYKNMKYYYLPQNKGCYKLIFNFLITILLSSVISSLVFFVYELTHSWNITNIITNNPINTAYDYFEIMDKVTNLPHINYFLMASIMFTIIAFMSRIKTRLLIPYYNLTISLPNLIHQRIHKKFLVENRKDLFKLTYKSDLIYVLIFIIGFVLGSITGFILLENEIISNTNVVLMIAGSTGFILSSFFLPMLLINYCFISDAFHKKYMETIKNELMVFTSHIVKDNPEGMKEDISKVFDEIIKNMEQYKTNDDNDDVNQDKD